MAMQLMSQAAVYELLGEHRVALLTAIAVDSIPRHDAAFNQLL